MQMCQTRRAGGRGLTLIEVLVVVLVTAVAFILVLPFIGRNSGCSSILACSTRLSQIHKGLILYSNDFGGSYPVPMNISPETAAISAQPGNSSANFFSYMIYQTYYSPELVTCPNEPSPNITLKTDFRYGAQDDLNWNPDWKWDPDFSADITTPGANVSYATLAMVGDRVRNQWRDSLDPNFAVAGDRGPRDGVWDAASVTLLRHGNRNVWTGSVVFNDGHFQEFTFSRKDKTSFTVSGDNLFRADDAEKGSDIWLGIFGATDERTTTPYWD